MKLIINPSTDPAYNLAMEEVLLTTCPEEIVMLWRNRPAVIVGRNQNAHAEIDFDFLQQHEIPLIRRLTGGGAVFHDLGNLNFTLLCDYEEGRFNDYKHFTRPVVGYLATLGIKAEQTGRNDLTIEGAKFSGNAQTVHKGRMLHHGTLLFNADLSRMVGALRPDPAKIASKGIKSVSSRVTNIYSHLPESRQEMTIEDFIRGLSDYFIRTGARVMELTKNQAEAAELLAESKYRTWDWNFGQSPTYECRRSGRFGGGSVQLCFSVEKGMIAALRIFGDFFGLQDIAELEQKLIGTAHQPEILHAKISGCEIGQYISGVSSDEFLTLFF